MGLVALLCLLVLSIYLLPIQGQERWGGYGPSVLVALLLAALLALLALGVLPWGLGLPGAVP
jgi:hypothetical protein